jgi:hypothetical protein
MKRNKLNLDQISVQSFVTSEESGMATFNGGINDTIIIKVASYIDGLEPLCLVLHTAEATEGIHNILTGIRNSNANTMCAGATHTNCNDTFSPCKV